MPIPRMEKLILQNHRRSGLCEVLRLLFLHRGVDVLAVMRFPAQPNGEGHRDDGQADDDSDRYSGDQDDVNSLLFLFAAVAAEICFAVVRTDATFGGHDLVI